MIFDDQHLNAACLSMMYIDAAQLDIYDFATLLAACVQNFFQVQQPPSGIKKKHACA